MFLLEAIDIKKQFSNRTVLDFPQLRIYEGDKIGIVGKNGSGKTTLLKILFGELHPDNGRVVKNANIQILSQLPASCSHLSGGEQQKLQIQKIIRNNNLLVFADEPTANLDHTGKKWLENSLKTIDTFLIISHDREFLDNLCNRIIEVKDGKLNFFNGNYTNYIKESEIRQSQLEENRRKYIAKKKQLDEAIKLKESSLSKMKKSVGSKKEKNNSQARLGMDKLSSIYKTIEHQKAILISRADKLEKPEMQAKTPKIRVDFELTNPPKNKRVIIAKDFSFSYDKKIVFNNVNFEVFSGEKLAICGDNGSGKTTLLKQIVSKNPAIQIVPKLKIGLLTQDFSHLNSAKTVLENSLENNIQPLANVYSVLSGLLFVKSDLNKKVDILSGGEKFRLSLSKLLLSDINALFLDEPTNYLDIDTLKVLEETLVEYKGVVVFISHDEEFVKKIATRKLFIENQKMIEKQTNIHIKPNKLFLELERDRIISDLITASSSEKFILEEKYFKLIDEIKKL